VYTDLGFFELGLEGLADELILVTLLAQEGVLGLERVEGAFKLLHISLLAFARILCGETVSGLAGFETSLALLIAGLSATASVGGFGGRVGSGRRFVQVVLFVIVVLVVVGIVHLALLCARCRVRETRGGWYR
jgi:hypothetical protein